MINNNKLEILRHLRINARHSFMEISRQNGTAQSTVYDRARSSGRLIKRHTALLNFEKLGLSSHIHLAIKIARQRRGELQEYLMQYPYVNSLYRVSEYDFLAECVFRNLSAAETFVDSLEQDFDCNVIKLNTISELKKEQFLTKRDHFEAINDEKY